MTIRKRLTYWYAAVLAICLMLMGLGTFIEIAEQYHHYHHDAADETAWHETVEMILEAGVPAVLLGWLGGWWLVRKALAPISRLTEAVEHMHERNLAQGIPHSGNGDELDRLTEVFNDMTGRLNASFQHIREFTLHASHELKTPLAIMRAELETALGNPKSTPHEKERYANQLDEIERLTKIVDGLTLLTKADAGQLTLKREPVRLDDLVRESWGDTKILGQTEHVEAVLEQCDEVMVEGDRHRLRQMLLNLADNAVKYNCAGGTVTFSLRRENAMAVLKVSNTGAGLLPEMQPRVFERFFRGQTSHNRDIDGCGLGLSIVKWIAEAHDGAIEFASEPGVLTTVTIKLPCRPQNSP